jgi:hypothetical protein
MNEINLKIKLEYIFTGKAIEQRILTNHKGINIQAVFTPHFCVWYRCYIQSQTMLHIVFKTV